MSHENTNDSLDKSGDVSRFEPHFLQYWEHVKDVVDENGWVYSKDVIYLLDSYFEHNTDQEILFEKHYDDKPWNGYRWKPKSILNVL